MKVLGFILQWVLAIAALALAVLALTPEEWKQKFSGWSALVYITSGPMLGIALLLALAAIGFCMWSRQQIVILPTRKQWWDKKLSPVILASEKLVVIDSYQSSKHQFWTSIEERLLRDEPFHFVLLDLAKDDPMLAHCVNTSLADHSVLDIDVRAVERLLMIRDKSGKGGNKTIEFGYWTGESQGPLVAWTVKGKETIAAGLWQQVEGNTDLSPWLVTKRGPLFGSLKRHYESLIHNAKAANNVHSSVTALISSRSGSPTTPGMALGASAK